MAEKFKKPFKLPTTILEMNLLKNVIIYLNFERLEDRKTDKLIFTTI